MGEQPGYVEQQIPTPQHRPSIWLMEIILVAAVADNRALGKDNQLAWHLPADWAFLTETVRDRWVIMGRRTYESHRSEDALPFRGIIAMTRQSDYLAEDAEVVHSLSEAYAIAETKGEEQLMVLGGGVIYDLAIHDAHRLLITEVHTSISGDAFFPEIDPRMWKEISRRPFPADQDNPYAYDFVEYQRHASH